MYALNAECEIQKKDNSCTSDGMMQVYGDTYETNTNEVRVRIIICCKTFNRRR